MASFLTRFALLPFGLILSLPALGSTTDGSDFQRFRCRNTVKSETVSVALNERTRELALGLEDGRRYEVTMAKESDPRIDADLYYVSFGTLDNELGAYKMSLIARHDGRGATLTFGGGHYTCVP